MYIFLIFFVQRFELILFSGEKRIGIQERTAASATIQGTCEDGKIFAFSTSLAELMMLFLQSRDQIKTEEAQLQGYVDEIARNKAKIEPIKAKLDEIGRHRAEIDRLRSTLGMKKIFIKLFFSVCVNILLFSGTLKSDKNATENTIKELRAHINEFYEGDIEELKRDIERFDVDQKRIMRELSDVSS